MDKSVEDQVLELIEGLFTNPPTEPVPDEWLVVRRLDDALHFCDKGKKPSGFDSRVEGGPIENWHDLLGRRFRGELAYEIDYGFDDWEERYNAYNNAIEKVRMAADKRVEKQIGWKAGEQADEDFELIFDLMHHPECTEKLPLELKRAYEFGVWPCGWLGKYPEGRLVVYWPYKDDSA